MLTRLLSADRRSVPLTVSSFRPCAGALVANPPPQTAEIAAQGVLSYIRHPVPFGANDGSPPFCSRRSPPADVGSRAGTHVNSFAPSDQQFTTTAGAGAFCLILNTIAENDGVLGQRYGIFASGIAAILASLVAPGRVGLGCGS